MAYNDDVAFTALEGGCLSETGSDVLPENTFDVAASKELDCKETCIKDILCGGYQRDPKTKRCRIFRGIDKLQGDKKDGQTCMAKVSQQMLTEIVEARGPKVVPKYENEKCKEESECEVGLRCAVYQRVNPSSKSDPNKSDAVLARWNKEER